MAEHIRDFVTGAEGKFESLRATVKSFVDDLLLEIIKFSVTDPIKNAVLKLVIPGFKPAATLNDLPAITKKDPLRVEMVNAPKAQALGNMPKGLADISLANPLPVHQWYRRDELYHNGDGRVMYRWIEYGCSRTAGAGGHRHRPILLAGPVCHGRDHRPIGLCPCTSGSHFRVRAYTQ